MSEEPLTISYDDAILQLPDGDEIHTFINPHGILVGADWSREEVLASLKSAKEIFITGPQAQAMNHGLAFDRGNWELVYIETKKEKTT